MFNMCIFTLADLLSLLALTLHPQSTINFFFSRNSLQKLRKRLSARNPLRILHNFVHALIIRTPTLFTCGPQHCGAYVKLYQLKLHKIESQQVQNNILKILEGPLVMVYRRHFTSPEVFTPTLWFIHCAETPSFSVLNSTLFNEVKLVFFRSIGCQNNRQTVQIITQEVFHRRCKQDIALTGWLVVLNSHFTTVSFQSCGDETFKHWFQTVWNVSIDRLSPVLNGEPQYLR